MASAANAANAANAASAAISSAWQRLLHGVWERGRVARASRAGDAKAAPRWRRLLRGVWARERAAVGAAAPRPLPQPKPTPALRRGVFGTREELLAAADLYLYDRTACKKQYGPIGRWTFPTVKNLDHLFARCSRNNTAHVDFDPDLGKWDVAHVVDMAGLFTGCHSFQGRGLAQWKVPNLKKAAHAFSACSAFDADLSAWRPVRLAFATGMFEGCHRFDADLSEWRPRLALVERMFKGCLAFKGEGLGNWDMSRSIDPIEMFAGCARFRGDLSGWDVARVRRMDEMFRGAACFDSNLFAWRPKRLSSAFNAFSGAPLFAWDLSAILVGALSPRDLASYQQYCRDSGRTPALVAAEARVAPKWCRLLHGVWERERRRAKTTRADEPWDEAEALKAERDKVYKLADRPNGARPGRRGSCTGLGQRGWAPTDEDVRRLLGRVPRKRGASAGAGTSASASASASAAKRPRPARADADEGLPEDDVLDEEADAAELAEAEELGIARDVEEYDESMDMDQDPNDPDLE